MKYAERTKNEFPFRGKKYFCKGPLQVLVAYFGEKSFFQGYLQGQLSSNESHDKNSLKQQKSQSLL